MKNGNNHTKQASHSLLTIGILIIIFTAVGWYISPVIIEYFLSLSVFTIITTAPFEMIQTRFTISIVFAVAAVLPIAYITTYKFISPALYKKESKIVKWSTIPFLFMFVGGLLFAIKVFLPVVLVYMNLFYVGDVMNSVTLSNYISFIISSMLLFGVVFCVPVVLCILSYIGVINYTIMKLYRRHVYVGILFAGAIITPPDAFTQLLVSAPLIVLYEMSIVVSYVISLKSINTNKVSQNG